MWWNHLPYGKKNNEIYNLSLNFQLPVMGLIIRVRSVPTMIEEVGSSS